MTLLQLKQIRRINRNIVECKCTRPYKCIVRHFELIETLWNVNAFLHRYKSNVPSN